MKSVAFLLLHISSAVSFIFLLLHFCVVAYFEGGIPEAGEMAESCTEEGPAALLAVVELSSYQAPDQPADGDSTSVNIPCFHCFLCH